MRYYKIPVFLHNLKNYDSHLISERANELSERGKIDVIAQNSEKFITFAFKNLCFKDSFSFLSSSLDKFVKLSKYEDGQKKQHWQKNFKFSKRNPYVETDEDLDLLTDKGVYPYDYFNSFDKFREKQLPPKEAFYSNLIFLNVICRPEPGRSPVALWEVLHIQIAAASIPDLHMLFTYK